MSQPSRTIRSKTAVAGGFAAVACAAFVLTPIAASAHVSRPDAPSKIRVVNVSRSSFTVAAADSAQRYRLFASTNHHNLYVAHLKGAKSTKASRTPRLTLGGLHYTAKPYYYRVEAINGSRTHFSATIGSVGLRPRTPQNLVAHSSRAGTSLTWDSRPATGFAITQATDPQMTQNVQTFTTENQDHQFAPPGLHRGTTYYYRVSALNGTTRSPATPMAQTTAKSNHQPVTVMTYNLLEATADGRTEGGNRVAPWRQRRQAQVSLIRRAMPDAISIQEGGSWVRHPRGPRQVDDLRRHLGGQYKLAHTEIPPSKPHYHRTGVYILYKSAYYKAVGKGNHWALGNSRWAAYQILKNKATGAKFLFVAPHLAVIKAGGTDQVRKQETKTMVAKARKYDARKGHLPIVYAGDFNSDTGKKHRFNGPSDYLLSKGYADSYDVAQSRHDTKYDSANGYRRRPPAHHLRLDYIFTQRGIAVRSWRMLLNLRHGRFAGVIPSDHNPVVAQLEIPY